MTLKGENLRKRYGRRLVVQGVDIELQPGEIVGLLGPNGAGKTTTFSMIVGIERPDAGRVLLDGEEITHLPLFRRARKGICYLPQEPSVFQGLTALENIIAVLERTGIPRRELLKRAEAILEEFGLYHLKDSRAYSLSGGERRRLEVARAMSLKPRYFLLDEPFQGVDPITVQDLKELFATLARQGIGILISDHQVRETLSLTHRAYILHRGQVICAGTPEEILEHPEVRSVYLGEGFRF
jgi:lipopolysaccharide export system ATP-binding protein